ncbi:RelA/SpoT family protein [Actinoallomurus purpureus]|uniref:RelA/SpoT family protein n=1 Tax=Actinoallomurus purpureus TaxID=478114 RepID=UPI002093D155|nr:HD domain-containing protein [Actinoallomurus purpureus]
MSRLTDPAGWFRRVGEDRAADPLIAAHKAHFPKANTQLLRYAYVVAEQYHRGQTRKSGAPYVTHPLAVALILADLGMDTTTLVATLLHDTVEDTDLTLGQVHAEFGEEVAILVDGVTKLDGSKWGDRAEAETFRKIILAAADDLRVLVIKLADRVHNLRTLRFHPKPEKRRRIAGATLELLVPFAERLGIYVFKREMEDIAFACLHPHEYERTRAAVVDSATGRAAQLDPLVERLRKALAESHLSAQVVTRDRHLYSLNQDRRTPPISPADPLRMGEATRITVLVDGDAADCYVALGAIHGLWRPLPGRMKDFIALPKYNMYQSLHTSVVIPSGEVLELAIRTRQMHRIAEYGIISQIQDAARASDAQARQVAQRADLQWLRNLLAWQAHAPSAEFLDSLRVDLRSAGIVTFTASGDVVPLPAGATAIDFAYALDADTGHRAIGALTNGRLSPMTAPLEDGQVIEVLTAAETESGPSEAWLESARTGHARVHIAQWLADRRTDTAGLAGRRLVADSLASRGANLLDLESDGTMLQLGTELGYPNLETLYAAVAANTVTVDRLTGFLRGPWIPIRDDEEAAALEDDDAGT